MPQSNVPPKLRPQVKGGRIPRAALYARVSTEEQTKKNYPSCESQIELLQQHAQKNGWQVVAELQDAGYSAGSLKRPQLSRLRQMVADGDIDVIVATYYDRLTRSREFFVLDGEFKANDVRFDTVFDPTDTGTAAGRFSEMILVAAKTLEREQTGEKVSNKARMRAEKGLFTGGHVPFGFYKTEKAGLILPDLEKTDQVIRMFEVYVQSRSDFAVRDWLKAHKVTAPNGKSEWGVSAIRYLLSNRRYIAEIEINLKNKARHIENEYEAYRIVAAPYTPIVPPELFETALAIRAEKGRESPNRTGRPRHYSRNQDGKVYLLSHIAVCGVCGASMTSHYTHHKAGRHRKKESYIHYYTCARQVKGLHLAGHRNRVLARRAEERILSGVQHLFETPEIVKHAMVKARERAEASLSPKKKQAADVMKSLQANKEAMERLVTTMTSGIFEGAAVEILQDQATQLKRERDRLEREHRQLTAELVALTENFDSEAFQAALSNFARLAEKAEPDELRRLLRLLIARIEWLPDGEPVRVHFYHMPKSPPSIEGGDWFATARQIDSSNWIRTSNPPINSRMLHR